MADRPVSYRSVSTDRAKVEDHYNASFVVAHSPERVCFHPDLTVTLGKNLNLTECDYCPAYRLHVRREPYVPPPYYYSIFVTV